MPPILSIDLTDAQADRLRAAVQDDLGLDTQPTLAQTRTHVIRLLRRYVLAHEREAAEEAIPEQPFDPA